MKNTIAVGQMTSGLDKALNIEKCESLIRKAAKEGAKVLSLPENFAYMGFEEESFNMAEEIEGATISRLRASAKENKIWLFLGGFQEKIPNSKKIYNTHLVINCRGELVSIYRKIHLFSVWLAKDQDYREGNFVEPGTTMSVVNTPWFKAGLSICYDLRFPMLFQGLREKGSEVLFIPAAFTKITGEAHWEILLRARAIETQCYVVASAQCGKHENNRETFGQAMIVDPWGRVLSRCGEKDNLAFAEIDLDLIFSIRKNMPIWDQRLKNFHE